MHPMAYLSPCRNIFSERSPDDFENHHVYAVSTQYSVQPQRALLVHHLLERSFLVALATS